tara:strand:+ start:54 stop:563 length:510 start_codon:yes stop_codon:yes gene_type:complete
MDNQIISTIGITEPVTLVEVKNYLRITNTRDDDYINSIIPNARIRAEKYLNSDILSKQRREYFAEICEPINFRYSPVSTVDAVTIEGVTMIVDTDYTVEGLDNPLFKLEQSSASKVSITYTTSGLDSSLVKPGILALVAELYHSRTEKVTTNWRSFLSPFKVFGYYGVR